MSFHKSGASLAAELRRIADLVDHLGVIGETLMHVGFQVQGEDAATAALVDRIDAALHGHQPGYQLPDYSPNRIFSTAYSMGPWLKAYAQCDPPQRIVAAAHAEALAEDAARSEQPGPGPELAMYDNVYAGWPA